MRMPTKCLTKPERLTTVGQEPTDADPPRGDEPLLDAICRELGPHQALVVTPEGLAVDVVHSWRLGAR
jgi:hypothetical protein